MCPQTAGLPSSTLASNDDPVKGRSSASLVATLKRHWSYLLESLHLFSRLLKLVLTLCPAGPQLLLPLAGLLQLPLQGRHSCGCILRLAGILLQVTTMTPDTVLKNVQWSMLSSSTTCFTVHSHRGFAA